MIKIYYPKYVKLENSALRLKEIDGKYVYFRDAGNWEVNININDKQELVSDIPYIPDLHNKKFIKITKKEWKDDNRGYV